MSEHKRPDIFDKIMHLPLLRILEPFYKKHKEGLLDLFFGAVTTLVGFLSFWLFDTPLGLNELLANLISWVLAVAVAYITNRIWVFANHAEGARGIAREIVAFYLSRVATLLMEEGILLIFTSWLGLPGLAVKAVASVLVVIMNYVFSKLIVFRKSTQKAKNEENM